MYLLQSGHGAGPLYACIPQLALECITLSFLQKNVTYKCSIQCDQKEKKGKTQEKTATSFKMMDK
jgi:hypothetical protein